MTEKHDPVNHPKHYNSHPSGIEAISITEYMSFNIGNAIKYLWRQEMKNGIEDLQKAVFYIKREIERLEREELNKHQMSFNREDLVHSNPEE